VDPDIQLPSLIDIEQFGESVRDSALPWDTIQTTRFRAGEPLDSTIESLTASQIERAKTDPNFQYLVDRTRDAEELRQRKTVSLNYEYRLEEREDELARELKRENERRAALHLEPLESLEDLEEEDLPDVLLDQAAGIAADLAEMRELQRIPAQTAQNRG
jgi:carboxyl-terminal processing protease